MMKTSGESKAKILFSRGVVVLALLCAAWFVFRLQSGTQWTPALAEEGLTAYENGDYAEAFRLFKRGDESGDPQSSFILGAMYLNGLGVGRNPAEAERLYVKAAENDYIPAMTTLGFLYAAGNILPENREAAHVYMAEAADKNDREAQVTLASWYENGFLGKKDTALAVKWYTKAARNGDKNAKLALALIYREGKGLVAPNIFTSKRWYDSIEKQSVYEKRFQGETLDVSE